MNWFYSLAGKFLGSKLNLQEGQLDTKKWWQSKTFWSDIVTILIAVYTTAQSGLATDLGHTLPTIPSWILAVLGGIGIYGRTTADTTITK